MQRSEDEADDRAARGLLEGVGHSARRQDTDHTPVERNMDARVAAGSDGAERDDTVGALFQTSDLDDAPRDLSAEHARLDGAQTHPTDAQRGGRSRSFSDAGLADGGQATSGGHRP
jgi:hypothetical protein